jgi:phosphate transport system permease protein
MPSSVNIPLTALTQPSRLTARVARLFRRGDHLLWISGGAIALALLMITGLLLLVFVSGFTFFWPVDVTAADRADGTKLLGVVTATQVERKDGGGQIIKAAQTQFKVGDRELYGFDFVWVPTAQLSNFHEPADAVQLERQEYGDFLGFLQRVEVKGKPVAEGAAAWSALLERLPDARRLAAMATKLQREEIGAVNASIQKAKLRLKIAQRKAGPGRSVDPVVKGEVDAELTRLGGDYDRLRAEASALTAQAGEAQAVMKTIDGKEKKIPLAAIVRAFRPNQMTVWEKLRHYCSRAAEFVYGEPRESNTEGGVFPAIFGTVSMTLIMSIVVTPFGVVAAFYLREYARQGPVVRLVRIAINNLAGVPSIVFGVFGLGFFVYFVGGGIDRIFFSEALPTPTFGTGGILWASLTLALLTVPVVIVATEESIAAVPRGAREGSLALGASKFQTILSIVLPACVPGILTGVILAMARGAGEVAPLMITGVVKLAPELPFDTHFPFMHLDRKFMHLGFHIYDVGFQSPNTEAAKPMVFTTTLLLIGIVVILNLAAIRVRDRIRKKYQTGAF